MLGGGSRVPHHTELSLQDGVILVVGESPRFPVGRSFPPPTYRLTLATAGNGH